MDIQKLMVDMGTKARSAARILSGVAPGRKNEALDLVARELARSADRLMSENRKDVT